jgi:hypothetical protein
MFATFSVLVAPGSAYFEDTNLALAISELTLIATLSAISLLMHILTRLL